MFVTLCVFFPSDDPPSLSNYIKILICLLRLKCDCTLIPLTPLVKNHQSIPVDSALQVQLLCASQVGPACASQTGGERGDFLSRDWVDWKEAPGWVPGENANITVQNRTKKTHKTLFFLSSSSPQFLFWLSSRKYLCCQTWTTSTFPWCTARWTVLTRRSVCPLSPNAPRVPPPSPSRGSHQRSLAQTLTSASPLITAKPTEEELACGKGRRRTSRDFVPLNGALEHDLELASEGWMCV